MRRDLVRNRGPASDSKRRPSLEPYKIKMNIKGRRPLTLRCIENATAPVAIPGEGAAEPKGLRSETSVRRSVTLRTNADHGRAEPSLLLITVSLFNNMVSGSFPLRSGVPYGHT